MVLLFRINRLKVIVKTANGDFGFDEEFDKRINFIASYGNTQGKSSCIESIYYCLGLEELIGGKKEKALKPVFKKRLKHNGKEIPVLESDFYLEIQNEKKNIITIYRTANKENYDSSLVTVYFGNMINLESGNLRSEDMYLHSQGSATSNKGFHKYLEEFLNWNLPETPTFEGVDRKLYLQTVFSAMFIEQKRGWADFFATLPTYFKIKEPKKRIIEFLIGLESLKNEKLKQKYKNDELDIFTQWDEKYNIIQSRLKKINCKVYGLPAQPTVMEEGFLNKVSVFKTLEGREELPLVDYLSLLSNKIESLNKKDIKICSNFGDLQEDLLSIKEKISNYDEVIEEKRNELAYEEGSINSIIRSIEILNKDILNNKDAFKLKKLGSSEDWLINRNVCPTCQQEIHDSLLPQDIKYDFMTIEENIKHLENQKKMMDYAMAAHQRNKDVLLNELEFLEGKIVNLRKIANSIVNDIYTNDKNTSEKIVREKILLENEIELLVDTKKMITNELSSFITLSDEWKELLSNKILLPKDKFTKSDRTTLKGLRDFFVSNLKEFGYSSIEDMSTIQINENKLLPSTEGFDMKFDSSASDNIRAIWAFTLALMQTSIKFGGNHSNVLIFDEPDQQSIVVNDMKKFFETFEKVNSNCQVIFGITLKDEETKKVISELQDDKYNLILLNEYSISPIQSKK